MEDNSDPFFENKDFPSQSPPFEKKPLSSTFDLVISLSVVNLGDRTRIETQEKQGEIETQEIDELVALIDTLMAYHCIIPAQNNVFPVFIK